MFCKECCFFICLGFVIFTKINQIPNQIYGENDCLRADSHWPY